MSGAGLPPWEAVNNGAGKLPWFVQREGADAGRWPGGIELWYLWAAAGHGHSLVRFGSYGSARRRADQLNAQEAK